MRRALLLASILMLSPMWVLAQYGSNSEDTTSRSTTARRMTIEGCLDGAIGNYTLTDPAGTSYRLTGNPEKLKAYVGDTMRITGVVTPLAYVPGAMSEGTETQPTLSVISLKLVSAVCDNTSY